MCQINAELTFLQAYHEAKSMQIHNLLHISHNADAAGINLGKKIYLQ